MLVPASSFFIDLLTQIPLPPYKTNKEKKKKQESKKKKGPKSYLISITSFDRYIAVWYCCVKYQIQH